MRHQALSRLAKTLGFWVVAALCLTLATQGAEPQQPGRILTKYALTSTHDFSYYDPRDWRLLGSTNGGQSWTTLDVQTNQVFGKRNERRSYEVNNNTAFGIYRLKIDNVNSDIDDPNPEDRQAQLAELEFIGPIVGATNEDDLGTLVSSSWSHPLIGPPENAFDNDLSTRWVDFGPTLPGGCWIQCQYVHRSELTLLVTNISQLAVRSRLAATHDMLLEKGPRILTDLKARDANPRTLTAYAVTSANDVPARDPSEWRLLGSDDDGETWHVVDSRSGERFSTRFERRVFTLAAPAYFNVYRLEIDQVGSGAGLAIQLGEIEPIYATKDDGRTYTIVTSAKTENPPAETSDMAFDGDAKTKWLSFSVPGPNDPCWIQWQCIPAEEGLPVINLRRISPLRGSAAESGQLLGELTAATNARARAMIGYALTSAEDLPNRDPRNWRLLGSGDNGRTWEILDLRTNQSFALRNQRQYFPIAKPAACTSYRLEVDSGATPLTAAGVQISKIEPLFSPQDTNHSYSILVSAAGDSGLREAGVKAFDDDPHTKWLDKASATGKRSSWIQWSYSAAFDPANPGDRVFDLDRMESASTGPQLSSVRPAKVRLKGVVICQNSESNTIGLLDDTGFQMFELDGSVPSVQPGDWALLEGPIHFGSKFPKVLTPRLTPAGSPPKVGNIGAEQRFRDSQEFLLGTASGTVTAISQGQISTTLRLLGDEESAGLRVKILNCGNASFVDVTGRHLEARGVVAPVFDNRGRRVAGTVWVSRPFDVNLAPLAENEWSRLRLVSINELAAPKGRPLGLVRVHGTFLSAASPESFVVTDGTNQLVVFGRQTTSLASGSAIDVAGFANYQGAAPALEFATARPAETVAPAVTVEPKFAETDPQHPITDIKRVNDSIRNSPKKSFAVKLRGVVTYIDLSLSDFYLQDGSDGIQVVGSLKAGLYPLLGQEGIYIELQGEVKDSVLHCTAPVTVLGRGRIPAPLLHSWDYLMTGRDDGLWVQVEGVVTAYEKQRLTLTVAGGKVIVWINQMDKDVQNRLLGSVVRVSGICAPVVNGRNQRLGLRLLVPSGEYVELVTAPPENPFDLPFVPIGRVMQLNSDAGSLMGQLVKTKGVITYRAPGTLFLQEGNDGVRVSLREESSSAVGDAVEVVGLPQPDGFSPQLAKALVRKTNRALLPPAKPLDLSDLSQDEGLTSMDATRARIEATFVGMSVDDTLRVLLFRIDKTEKTFSAFLPLNGETMPDMSPGSRVRLDGVFKAKVDNAPDFGQVITSFEMYLNSPSDLTVLARPPWWTLKHTLGLLGALGLVLLLSLGWAGMLHRKVAQRTRELRDEIDERKRVQADADKAHRDLVVAARQAGMAEVAIGVLHNVGNVLNSVNVSSSIVVDKMRQLKLGGLTKAIALLRQNQNSLGAFLSSDDKGKRVLPYLEKLAGHVEAEQAGALEELDNLCRNVEHIKDIITVQQNYATFAGLTEPLQVVDLVEDALRMNASSLERHDVRIIREFENNPPKVNADKHKILQILVNVVRNAEQACEESGRADKEVVIRVINGDGSVKVSASDNGVGIAPENVERIFNHGFTTRKNGHGFGLHTSALAAKEMGGILRFSSEGPGKGATFTLELPVSLPNTSVEPMARAAGF